jgi:flagellar protein FlaG
MDLSTVSLVGLYQAANQKSAQLATPQQRAEQARLMQAVKTVNQSGILGDSDELSFSTDQASGRLVVKLINKETKEVLRQIPPEYVLRLAEDPERAAR